MRRSRRTHLRLGRRGERLASALLRELGFSVLTRNYSGRHGEVDLVARRGGTLSFVEVKTRSHPHRGRPGAAVGPAKQARIIRTAHRYLRELGFPPVPYRFDVVEVVLHRRRLLAIHYWPGAFTEQPRGFPLEQRFPDMSMEYVAIRR